MKILPFRPAYRRRLVASLMTVVLGVFGVASSAAGEGHGGRMRAQAMRQAPFAGRGMRAERPAAIRAQQAREQAPPPAVPQVLPVERVPEAPPVDRNGRPGRLSPEERRALRQQINDAGRDIYRAPRP